MFSFLPSNTWYVLTCIYLFSFRIYWDPSYERNMDREELGWVLFLKSTWTIFFSSINCSCNIRLHVVTPTPTPILTSMITRPFLVECHDSPRTSRVYILFVFIDIYLRRGKDTGFHINLLNTVGTGYIYVTFGWQFLSCPPLTFESGESGHFLLLIICSWKTEMLDCQLWCLKHHCLGHQYLRFVQDSPYSFTDNNVSIIPFLRRD